MAGPLKWLLTRVLGCALALLIGIVTIAVVYLLGPRNSLDGEWGFLAFQAVLVAIPFGYLALSGVGAKTPWIVAAILTVMLWSLPVAYGWALRGAGGVPIGLAVLLLISPFFITPGALLAGHLAGGLRGPTG